MLYSIKGKLIHKEPYLAVIEAGGVGFKCIISLSTMSRLPDKDSEATLFTYLHVREDILDLYGFYDLAELNCFKLLISVSGVGPKAALAILSDLSPERFALCVSANDSKTITGAPGIGPKLAQRIILELKDKIKAADVAQGISGGNVSSNIGSGNASEAVSALVVLGYSQSDAAMAVSSLDPAMPSSEMIRSALKYLAAL